MTDTPLRDRVVAELGRRAPFEAPFGPGEIVDIVLEVIGNATPAAITEEGSHLLGASHLWADTQGTKATEHMVRRITAADQIVRSRLEAEVAGARELIELVRGYQLHPSTANHNRLLRFALPPRRD